MLKLYLSLENINLSLTNDCERTVKVMMIKNITRKDIPACVDVIQNSFLSVAEQFGLTSENAPRFTAFSITAKKLTEQMEKEGRLMRSCFSDDGEIVGYYSLLFSDNRECELNNLCVLSEYRHCRIGSRLLRDAFKNAEETGCVRMKIGIIKENRVLKEWYEKNGFVHVGTKKFDFFPFTCGYMEKALV